MPTDPSDRDVARELRRRSESVVLPGDWAERELLPSIRAGIYASATGRPPSPRLGPLAGLVGVAGVAGVLFLLVVAVPGLVPGSQTTTQPPNEAMLVVLSPHDFATRLAAGEIEGSTVLVEGRIDPGPPVPRPPCDSNVRPCFMGELSGIEPALAVSARLVPTSDDDAEGASVLGGEGVGWSFWRLPGVPVEGVLVLRVAAGSIEYLGHLRQPAEQLASSAIEAAELDLMSLALHEIVLVDGWLTGVGGLISGVPPAPGTFIAGLPQRWEGNPAWVLDEPVALDPDGFFPPADGIRVQNHAYFEFAPDPAARDEDGLLLEPRAAVYALARRLEGGGCPDDRPPCWRWNVVGRIARLASAAAPSQAPETITIVSAKSPATQAPAVSPSLGPTPPLTPSPSVQPGSQPSDGSTPQPSAPPASTPAGPVILPGDPAAGTAVWHLAPGERPTVNSRSIEVVVDQEACASGQSPEGRILGPAIEYRPDVVVVSFGVRPLPGDQDCQGAPSAPATIHLAEPLGERNLVDAGGRAGPTERVTFEDGFVLLTTRDAVDVAHQRLLGWLGGDACTQTVSHDRDVAEDYFEQRVAQVGGGEGFDDSRSAWLGHWRDAARAFDAFEAFASPDGDDVWIMAVAAGQEWLGTGEDGWLAADIPYGALIVADLHRAEVSGDRTLWLPAFTFHTAGTANCTSGPGNWPDPNPGPGSGTGTVSGDFRLAITSGRTVYAADEPIEIEGALTYTGPAEAVTVHAGGGLLQFGFQQLDGDLEMDAAAVALGKDFELARGRAFVRPYSKSGGWSNDDPNAEFYADFIADPQFRLPRGVWRVYVWTEFVVEPDGDDVTLTSSIVITTR